jgi:hypothetical protein
MGAVMRDIYTGGIFVFKHPMGLDFGYHFNSIGLSWQLVNGYGEPKNCYVLYRLFDLFTVEMEWSER